MATLNKSRLRKKYTVLVPYQCPNHKHWHQKGEEVELLPCESDFLILGGKVKKITVSVSKQKENK